MSNGFPFFFLLQNYRSFTKSLNDVPIIMVAYLIKYQIL